MKIIHIFVVLIVLSLIVWLVTLQFTDEAAVTNTPSEKSSEENTVTLHLLSPNGGESYCLGASIPVLWEGSPELQTVNVWAKRASVENTVGEFAAFDSVVDGLGKGGITWDGTTASRSYLVAGETYYIRIFSRDQDNNLIEDTSDAPFALVSCG